MKGQEERGGGGEEGRKEGRDREWCGAVIRIRKGWREGGRGEEGREEEGREEEGGRKEGSEGQGVVWGCDQHKKGGGREGGGTGNGVGQALGREWWEGD